MKSRSLRRPWATSLTLTTLVAVGLSGCAPSASSGTAQTVASATRSAQVQSGQVQSGLVQSGQVNGVNALHAAKALPVKGRAPKTGYSRAQFGPAWFDANRNHCDTRDDILRRDLKDLKVRAGTHGCIITSGVLQSPYTGKPVHYVRGHSTVDIDHVVALEDAWQTGASAWVYAKRVALANDPLNLLAVDLHSNRAKGDGDTATWLPPNRGYRCQYVARQVAVKTKYKLWVTTAEKAAMIRVLSTCPKQVLPRGTASVLAPIAKPKPSPKPAPGAHLDPRFATCKAAKAAGYGPYRKGIDPEYGWYQDADSDGTVCE